MDGQEAMARRKALGWSLARLARLADISEPTLRSFERGDRDTNPALVRSIVEAIRAAEQGAGQKQRTRP